MRGFRCPFPSTRAERHSSGMADLPPSESKRCRKLQQDCVKLLKSRKKGCEADAISFGSREWNADLRFLKCEAQYRRVSAGGENADAGRPCAVLLQELLRCHKSVMGSGTFKPTIPVLSDASPRGGQKDCAPQREAVKTCLS